MADVLECEVITQLEHIQEILNDVSVEYYSMSPTIFDCCATCSGSCSVIAREVARETVPVAAEIAHDNRHIRYS